MLLPLPHCLNKAMFVQAGPLLNLLVLSQSTILPSKLPNLLSHQVDRRVGWYSTSKSSKQHLPNLHSCETSLMTSLYYRKSSRRRACLIVVQQDILVVLPRRLLLRCRSDISLSLAHHILQQEQSDQPLVSFSCVSRRR